MTRPVAYMAFGLQSGGTTMVSYCFLQRSDLSGILDWFHDRLPIPSVPSSGDTFWCKCTVASFSAVEVIAHVEQFGFRVRPVLILRDVRRAFDSLIEKPYGRNATTAEDPPLRLRFQRFLRDWEHFHAHNLPTMTFEDFAAKPEQELRRICAQMGLPWDDAMVQWPKETSAIWDGSAGNESFLNNIGDTLPASIRQDLQHRKLSRLSQEDIGWLEREFAEYNHANGYVMHLDPAEIAHLPEHAALPRLENASRYRRMRARTAVRGLLLGLPRLRRRFKR